MLVVSDSNANDGQDPGAQRDCDRESAHQAGNGSARDMFRVWQPGPSPFLLVAHQAYAQQAEGSVFSFFGVPQAACWIHLQGG